MSPAVDMPMPEKILALGPGRFNYINLPEAKVVFFVDTCGDEVYVIGHPEHGSYEWVACWDGGKVSATSNQGYGIAAVALRDGLASVLD